MEVKEKIFPCLICGSDTGCPNKLICDKCRRLQKQKTTLIRGRKVEKGNG
ncbi:hypothetical protein KAW18_17165 [candidate division WOR-3 bacterium]|nr:hypothetical protein [candidate division WOR-3 bacterium]